RAATWAGVACCGAGTLSQKPRALMISVGVCGAAAACGFGSVSAEAAADAGFRAGAALASAAASCRAEGGGLSGLFGGLLRRFGGRSSGNDGRLDRLLDLGGCGGCTLVILLAGGRLALEQGGQEARRAGALRPLAIAAALDVAPGELIALHRTAG